MRILFFLFILSLGLTGYCQSLKSSPFNSLPIEIDSSGSYEFIVSGHFHGSGSNMTGYPTNSLLGNLDSINALNSNFMICLGDLFLDVSNDIPFYKKSLFSKLNMPLFNAVGNHDLTDEIYQNNFGETYYTLILGRDIHLVLDTELDDGSIKNAQLSWFKSISQQVEKDSFDNVFIYSHRTIWSKNYSEMNSLFKDNTQSVLGNNFEKVIYPIIEEWTNNSDVYWFSGSLGNAPASFFYFEDKDFQIKYIATAIRGVKRDAVLIVNSKLGEVSFSNYSLTGQDLMPLNDYNIKYWNEKVGKKPFNFRLVPLYFINMFTHRYFWYGLIWTVFGAFSIRLILKLINKKSN